jgi:hypothetical protein
VLSLLGSVVQVLEAVPYLIASLLIDSLNGWFALIGVAAAAAIAILPGFPSLPQLPGEWGAAVSWFLPLETMLGIFTGFILLWVAWWGISSALRWAKVVGS